MAKKERASSHVDPGGGDGDDDEDEPKTLEEVLEAKAERAFAAQFGIELAPTKGEITDIIDYLAQGWDMLQQLPSWGPIGAYKTAMEAQWMTAAESMLAPYRGYGISEGAAEWPGDPLKMYFESVDRMMNEMMGPYPEARYFGAEGYREAFETLTPSSFDEWLQAQEEDLRGEFMSELFLEKQTRMEQFGAELAGLPEEERYARMLQLSEATGLPAMPTYEEFLTEKRPQLEQKYRYLKPLGDEPQKAWAEAFEDLYGEGRQVTPFSQFLGRRQEGLMQQYEDLVREQLREGTALGELPDLEGWFRQQRPGIEQAFELSGPQYTGRTPTGVFRPKKRIM